MGLVRYFQNRIVSQTKSFMQRRTTKGFYRLRSNVDSIFDIHPQKPDNLHSLDESTGEMQGDSHGPCCSCLYTGTSEWVQRVFLERFIYITNLVVFTDLAFNIGKMGSLDGVLALI